MKIFFIIDETTIMLPKMLDGVLERLSKQNLKIVGITPTHTRPGQKTFSTYLVQNIWKLKPVSILKILVFFAKAELARLLFDMEITNTPATIEQVGAKYRLKILNTKRVNDPIYLSKLSKLRPDIIVSSGSQIFKSELLSLPKIACINRHSALLPSYGGLFPVFQALINGERKVGVSVHYMIEGIDKGKVIFQEEIPISKTDTLFSLYEKSYNLSIKAIVSAIEIIKDKKKPVILKSLKPSYYSFPTDNDWKRFFKKNLKFI